MHLDEICTEIEMAVGPARNKLCADTFTIPTWKSGNYAIAEVRNVGEYIALCGKS